MHLTRVENSDTKRVSLFWHTLHMKFVYFSVSENGENGLGDEGTDGAMPPPPRIFGL